MNILTSATGQEAIETEHPANPLPDDGDLPLSERAELILAAARTLQANGQETSATLDTVSQLGHTMGVEASLYVAWNLLLLRVKSIGQTVSCSAVASPRAVGMNRVASAMGVLDRVSRGEAGAAELKAGLASADAEQPENLYAYVLACVTGACAIAFLFGATEPAAFGLIALSAALGGLLRRLLGSYGASGFVQAGAAAFIAGLAGALAVRLKVTTALDMVPLCPSMILVPGPYILNGALDIAGMRLSLGAARLTFATVTLVSICAGLLVGLALGGAALPPFVSGRDISLWTDMLAAGVAAGSYAVYFSMPTRMLPWPIVAGMVAHGVRWYAIAVLGFGAAAGAGIACLVAGSIIAPIAHRLRLPFAGAGFAAVVSMIPGSFLFRMGGGLVQIQQQGAAVSSRVVGATLSDAITALLVVIAMTIGLIIPKTMEVRARARAASPGTPRVHR